MLAQGTAGMEVDASDKGAQVDWPALQVELQARLQQEASAQAEVLLGLRPQSPPFGTEPSELERELGLSQLFPGVESRDVLAQALAMSTLSALQPVPLALNTAAVGPSDSGSAAVPVSGVEQDVLQRTTPSLPPPSGTASGRSVRGRMPMGGIGGSDEEDEDVALDVPLSIMAARKARGEPRSHTKRKVVPNVAR